MKIQGRVASIAFGAAGLAAVACGSKGGSSDSASNTSQGGASSESSTGAVTSGSGTGASSGARTSSASTGSSQGTSTGDNGAMGVQCGGSLCAPPESCCQTGTATPACVVACGAGQQQLCGSDDDCQSSGSAFCNASGFCVDPSLDGGGPDVYVPPLEGGVLPPGDGGSVPAGYPTPTPGNVAKCQTTTALVAGFCPGGGAGPVCIECLFGGSDYNEALTPAADGIAEAGNYLVTVQLGGAAAGETFVGTESSRGLLAPVATKAGQTTEFAFSVNVRSMEGQPNHAGGPGGYPGLDLFFSGPTSTPPQITGIGYALATSAAKLIQVFIASDSTACDQTGNVFAGWGQMLPEYFGPPVTVANYANSGASSGSFGPYWADIKAKWVAGDWVLIQFGHNDKGIADSVVQANLEGMVTDALAAKVIPVVISPPARVQFGSGTVDGDQSSLHAAAAKAAAAAKNVAYIDLTTLSTAWYNSLGSQAAALKFHAMDSDATHTNLAGATILAGLVADAMKNQNIALAKYLR